MTILDKIAMVRAPMHIMWLDNDKQSKSERSNKIDEFQIHVKYSPISQSIFWWVFNRWASLDFRDIPS